MTIVSRSRGASDFVHLQFFNNGFFSLARSNTNVNSVPLCIRVTANLFILLVLNFADDWCLFRAPSVGFRSHLFVECDKYVCAARKSEEPKVNRCERAEKTRQVDSMLVQCRIRDQSTASHKVNSKYKTRHIVRFTQTMNTIVNLLHICAHTHTYTFCHSRGRRTAICCLQRFQLSYRACDRDGSNDGISRMVPVITAICVAVVSQLALVARWS